MKQYRPSWIDYLVNKIERLPGQPWVFYLVVLLLTGLLNNVALWLDGAKEIGTIYTAFTFASIFTVYGVVFYHYLRRVALKSLQNFFPELDPTSHNEEDLKFQMTILPVGWGLLALILGSTIAFIDIYTSTPPFTINTRWFYIYMGVLSAFNYAAFIAFLFQTARQLSIIIKLHQQVEKIDVFNLTPLRAFSQLTATAGFAVFFIGALSVLLFQEETDPALISFYIGLVMLGVLIFIAPLISITTQINKKKKQLLLETDQDIKHLLEEVRQCVQTGDLTKMGDFNTTLSVLEKEKTILKGISSYPWNPGTFKSFISTILLPLLLWWIRYLLEKWL